MINTIIENLYTTFRSSGGNVNEQIHNSEEILINLSTNIEFYPSLFSIIQSNEIPVEIRKAAMIFLQFLINKWSTSLSEGAKMFIIQNFPLLLKNSLQFLSIDLKLTESLVNCTFFAGNFWLDIFDIINSGFCNFENEKEQAYVSIILLNSISQHYKKRYDIFPPPVIDNFYPFLQNFIIFSLNQFFEENGKDQSYLPFVAICFQTIRYFNSMVLSPFFNENVSNLNQLLIQTTRISNFEEKKCSIDVLLFLSRQMLKFASKMIQKYPEKINNSVSIQILQSFFEFFEKFHNYESLMSSSARLINAFLFFEPTFDFISKNGCSIFIVKLIFPFFYLNSQDIENSKYDPSQFLAKFQTQDYFFESESRAYLYQTIVQKTSELCENDESHELPNFCIVIFNLFNKVVNNYINDDQNHSESEDAILFSLFFLFSSIHPSIPFLNNDLLSQLMNLISQLFTSPSHLVISAILILVKYLPSYLIPPAFYVHIAQLLISHPSQLVRYYASVTFCEIVKETFENQQIICQTKIILESCSQFLPDVFKSYIELSALFNDSELIEYLSEVMITFRESLVDVAPQLIIQIFEIFLNYSNSSNSKGKGIIDSLFDFIKKILDENNSIEFIMMPLLNCIYQFLTTCNTVQSSCLQDIFEFIAKLSLVSSFDFSSDVNENDSIFQSIFAIQIKRKNVIFPLLFWKLYEIIPTIIENAGFELIENGFYAMRSIFICNPENLMNDEILNFTLQIGNKFLNQFGNDFCDELFATMLLLATVFIIAPPQTIPNINEMYHHIIIMLKNFFDHYETWIYSSILFLSMLIQNPTTAFQMIKLIDDSGNTDKNDEVKYDCVAQFCLKWADISDSFLQMLFILNFHQVFPPEINYVFIEKVLNAFKGNFETFGFDDQEQNYSVFISPNIEKVALPCSLILFDSNIILFYFGQFMESISQSFPELANRFNEEMQAMTYYLNNDDANNIANFEE